MFLRYLFHASLVVDDVFIDDAFVVLLSCSLVIAGVVIDPASVVLLSCPLGLK